MNNYEKLTINDVCDFIGGSQPPKSIFSDKKLPNYIRLVQTRDFKTDNFITYIPRDSTTKFFKKDDIMIGRYGPPIFQIFRGMEGAYNVALLKAKPKSNINNDYLFYFLKQKNVFEYVDKLSARTGGQTGVDLVSLNKYPIFLPDLPTQQKIASVLSALDDKIELNNRINAELEAMAKTLYDYWFVQFDFPYSPLSEGCQNSENFDGVFKPYKSSGGKMVYNSTLKREIPEGWEVKTVGEFSKIKKGTLITEKTANTKGNVKVVSAGLDFSYFHSESNFPSNTITISASGANAGYINFWREPIFACDCTTVRGNNDFETFYILHFLKSVQEFIYSQARGSAQPHVYPKDIEALNIIVPNEKILTKYGEIVYSMNEKITNNLKQNQELSALRDWLLPMLMNGQVKVG
ncbi:restriction endonuclease subunit S [Cloacibacterium caeni]|uniref:restriction endonuclease subunit S n=1 Tax=Cloacibacterium caeni TaxID=2004710 RepID=UPI001BCD0C5A|nr:restriction endonuclease subunit S [Cloacibacterium caeni]